jgi:uncharacterized protein YfdQ (DUF2303 family)
MANSYPNDDTNLRGDVQAAIAALERREHKLVEVDYGGLRIPFAVLPAGVKVETLKPLIDQWRPVPERMRGRVQLNELDSLAAFVNRHKRDESIIFVDDSDLTAPTIEVIFDAHQPESVRLAPPMVEGAMPAEPSPGWQDFRATYAFPLTPAWKAWFEAAGKWLSQAAFASFLEERIDEVLDPSDPGEPAKVMAEKLGFQLAGAGKLLEVSRGLQLRVNQHVVSAQNLSTGEVQVVFDEKHEDSKGGPLKVPGGFAIAVPVFRGGALYRIPVRLRYRTDGGRVVWQLLPHRLDQVFENAIEGAAQGLREKTALPVLRGKP